MLLAQNQMVLEQERRNLETMSSLTPQQIREKEILEMQQKLTEEQQIEIQNLVANVVAGKVRTICCWFCCLFFCDVCVGQELSAEQQNILKTFLTPAQLEEVRVQMMANLEAQKLELQQRQQEEVRKKFFVLFEREICFEICELNMMNK